MVSVARMKGERLLVIGNGMASVRFCEELLANAPGRHAVTVVGAEPCAGYNRVLLSALLAGDTSEADIALRGADWYAENDITLITGQRVEALDLEARTATLSEGRVLSFDRAVFATGSTPFRLPTPGMEKPGVMTFRDTADLARMLDAARAKHRVAVIGGGLLGIEAACALAKIGAGVTLLHVMDRLMERQLDHRSAAFLKRAIESKGVRVRLNAQTVAVEVEDRAETLIFADGSRLDVDLVVVAVGVRPNIALAQASGIAVKRGILVDDRMTTDLTFIHAIGECVEHRGQVYGLVEPAYQQAAILAEALGGNEAAAYGGTALSTNLKVSGVPVFSAGNIEGGPGTEVMTLEDRGIGVCKRLVLKDGALVGAVLVGEAEDALWYRDLIRTGEDVAPFRDGLFFGPAFCAPDMREAA